MYLNDDTVLRVRLATHRARELESQIRSQIERSRALTDRAAAARRSETRAALRPAVEAGLQAHERLSGEAREHLRRSHDLLSRAHGVE